MATHSFTCKQTIPAFTSQPQSITALWLVLILPSHERKTADVTWVAGYITKIKCHPPRPGSRTLTQSPIPVLTGLGVGYLRWSRPSRCHWAKPPPVTIKSNRPRGDMKVDVSMMHKLYLLQFHDDIWQRLGHTMSPCPCRLQHKFTRQCNVIQHTAYNTKIRQNFHKKCPK